MESLISYMPRRITHIKIHPTVKNVDSAMSGSGQGSTGHRAGGKDSENLT